MHLNYFYVKIHLTWQRYALSQAPTSYAT